MSVLSATVRVTTQSTLHGPSDMRLRGRWLAVARVGFVVLAAVVVALNVVALPDIAASQLTPDVLRDLHRQGFSPTLYAAVGVAESVVTTLTYLAMGLLVFWRRSDDRMALVCAVMLVTFGGVAATPLDDVTGGSPMPEPLGSIAVLRAVVYLLVVVGQVSFVVFFYLFPSGRFVPRWTRWCAALSVVYWLVEVFFPALSAGPLGGLIIVFFVIAAIAQIYRYRRVSTLIEREQTKWIVFGLVLAVVIIVVPSLLQLLVQPSVANSLYSGPVIVGVLISATWPVALLLIPIFIAVAILRTHLWDIDVIINRALVYGTLTALLAAVYFGIVIGAQAAAQALTGQGKPQPVIIVTSTLLIAALFNPLRRRIQATIDHRFYRHKYDAARTLAAFGVSLRHQVELTELNEHLLAVVEETMQPAHVSLWLPAAADTRHIPIAGKPEGRQLHEGGAV